MVPQHNHDLHLVVSQSGAEMMDTGAVQVEIANNSGVPLTSLLVDATLLQQQQQQQLVNGQTVTMVQQQQLIPPVLFGSQMVDKNSSTPYTDATQVPMLKTPLVDHVLFTERPSNILRICQFNYHRGLKRGNL